MANDREQKIRDVYDAMLRVQPGVSASKIENLDAYARAAVDVLDPVKRIKLSGGFHAEPAPADPTRYNVLDTPGPHTIRSVGNLSKEAVEAWALEVDLAEGRGRDIESLKQRIAAAERHKLAVEHNAMCMELENAQEDMALLKKTNAEQAARIAALGKIIEALNPIPEG
jgi:hypothetical protein